MSHSTKMFFVLLAALASLIHASFSTDHGTALACSPVIAAGSHTLAAEQDRSLGSFVELSINPIVNLKSDGYGYLIYNYADEDRIGYRVSANNTTADSKDYFCFEESIGQGSCTKDTVDQLAISDPQNPPKSIITSAWIRKPSAAVILHPVDASGIYCIRIVSTDANRLELSARFLQNHGELPAILYRSYQMWIVLGLALMAGSLAWAYLHLKNRASVSTCQNLLGILLVLMTVEAAIHVAYYRMYNLTGASSQPLRAAIDFLAAAKSTAGLLTAVLLSVGYGSLTSTLGERRILLAFVTAVHFVANLINSPTVDMAMLGWLAVLLRAFPVALTHCLFYQWICSSSSQTIESLDELKQPEAFSTQRTLYRVVRAAFWICCIMMAATIALATQKSDTLQWNARHWSTMWFWNGGWSAILTTTLALSVALLFRPTRHQTRYNLVAPQNA